MRNRRSQGIYVSMRKSIKEGSFVLLARKALYIYIYRNFLPRECEKSPSLRARIYLILSPARKGGRQLGSYLAKGEWMQSMDFGIGKGRVLD